MTSTVKTAPSTTSNSAEAAETLFAAISNRRSSGLSRLSTDLVDRRLIEHMLEAANWAPSHGDTEPWRFTVFSGNGREALAELFDNAHRDRQNGQLSLDVKDGHRKRVYAAPVWISIGMSPARRENGSLLMTEEEEIIAVACAVQNLHLMASTLGLAGMWHSKGSSVDPFVARGLGLEPPDRLLGFFMCGKPASDPPQGIRRPMSEKVTWVEDRS